MDVSMPPEYKYEVHCYEIDIPIRDTEAKRLLWVATAGCSLSIF